MVIVRSTYKSIKKPELTDNWILQLDYIKNIYDIDRGKIGIKFNRMASILEYQINLEDESEDMLASELLDLLIQEDGNIRAAIIYGEIKTR